MRTPTISSRENYLAGLSTETPLMQAAHTAAERLNKKPISLGSNEGAILQFLVKLSKCRTFVEIGTLTGYSALWILAALDQEGSQLWTLEKDEAHASAAKNIFAQLTEQKAVHLLVGDALENLKKIEGPVDGVFIDANKSAYGEYLNWAEKNVKKGGIIIADNVFLRGTVYDKTLSDHFSDKQIQVMQSFNHRLADPKNYTSCLIPTGEGLFAAIKNF